jgi:hypothetical protein
MISEVDVEVGLLGSNAVWTCSLIPTFQGWKWLHMFLRNVGIYLHIHTALQPRRPTWRLMQSTGDSRYTRFHSPCFRTSAVLFQYHEKHQYLIRGQILVSGTCVEPSPGLSGDVMQIISLLQRILAPVWHQNGCCYTFPFYAFSIYAAISSNATPVYKESHLYSFFVSSFLLNYFSFFFHSSFSFFVLR